MHNYAADRKKNQWVNRHLQLLWRHKIGHIANRIITSVITSNKYAALKTTKKQLRSINSRHVPQVATNKFQSKMCTQILCTIQATWVNTVLEHSRELLYIGGFFLLRTCHRTQSVPSVKKLRTPILSSQCRTLRKDFSLSMLYMTTIPSAFLKYCLLRLRYLASDGNDEKRRLPTTLLQTRNRHLVSLADGSTEYSD